MSEIKVVDLFAGPGGLGEGFARFSLPSGTRPFRLVVSAEKDAAAVLTLRLRTFFRLCEENGTTPPAYYEHLRGRSSAPFDSATKPLWRLAEEEAQPLELGTTEGNRRLHEAIQTRIDPDNDDWILIGGPPCQAYSLVGRSRNKGIQGYKPDKDQRHFLYREYLKLLSDFRPAAFVMENVKGILSSRVGNQRIFPRILEDLSSPGNGRRGGVQYRIHSLTTDTVYRHGDDPESLDPNSFIVRAEDFGVPQARHRVILVGIRDDGTRTPTLGALQPAIQPTPLEAALQSMPHLRSGISTGDGPLKHWISEIESAFRTVVGKGLPTETEATMRDKLEKLRSKEFPNGRGGLFVPVRKAPRGRSQLEKNYLDKIQNHDLGGVPNHQARTHMPMDLVRYLFAASAAHTEGISPKARDFPQSLAPKHRNWKSGHFADRFRVQMRGKPSTTITSHISKDGHYFIHYDPCQCRSLTVREAARLQTFPDDYFFEGNRTQQYVQVGNAVPPLLAEKIAELLHSAVAT